MQQKLTKIALVLDKGLNYWRGVMHGVLGYAHARPQWVLHTVPNTSPARLDMLRRWEPAGVLADVVTPEAEAALAALGVPVVCVSHALAGQRFPRVRRMRTKSSFVRSCNSTRIGNRPCIG